MAASPHTDNLLKELALLVQQGRFKETRDWLEAGKPFRATSYRIHQPPRTHPPFPRFTRIRRRVLKSSNPGYGLITIALADSPGDLVHTE